MSSALLTFISHCRGPTAAGFAGVASILLALLFGIVAFGAVIGAVVIVENGLQRLVAAAARLGAGSAEVTSIGLPLFGSLSTVTGRARATVADTAVPPVPLVPLARADVAAGIATTDVMASLPAGPIGGLHLGGSLAGAMPDAVGPGSSTCSRPTCPPSTSNGRTRWARSASRWATPTPGCAVCSAARARW